MIQQVTQLKAIGQRVVVSMLISLLLWSLPALCLPSTSVAFLSIPIAQAQRFDPDQVWRQIYEQHPDLPLENQYRNQETGETVPENTLIGRFIRYHIYVKGRPPFYRLDWKISLADYLGVNDFIFEPTYPSADTLDPNPRDGDIAAIQSLNRAQREALVQSLVDIFGVVVSPNASPASPTPSPSPTPSAPRSAPLPRSPQPGDADLLRP